MTIIRNYGIWLFKILSFAISIDTDLKSTFPIPLYITWNEKERCLRFSFKNLNKIRQKI